MTSLAELAAQLSPNARELLAKELVRQGTKVPSSGAEPIAVVGIGCRLPGGVDGPDRYWKFLQDAGDAITVVPGDRWDADAFYDADPMTPGRMTTKWGGFIDDVAGFDAEFFGITPREARAMDPQQRILLEVAWEALENAGIPADSLAGTRTGVIMGAYSNEYQSASAGSPDTVDAYTATGNAHSITVGRVSYLLGLRGPAIAVDTACSSSLVAVHLACQSLRLGESDLVLAGGVQLSLSPYTTIALSKWSALSPVGQCKTFDADADGFVRGEGCGVVVLKRLSDAVRDGDRVVAVVRGSAVNQDGRSNGLTAPNALAQRDVIGDALRVGDVPAETIDYVETHGTGTVLGDPIEFEALTATYGRGASPCALGAVKTNIGHLEAAAGIAGFIKAALALNHRHIPANLHFNQWNPAIDPTGTRFFVPTAGTPWPAGTGPRRAAVSSFGIGGTNAHVVLEQGPEPVPAAGQPDAHPAVTTLVLTGRTADRVSALAADLAGWMDGEGASVPLADIAHTLDHHRAHHEKRASVAAVDRGQAIAGLKALAGGQPAVGVVAPQDVPVVSGTVFVYSGQGSQWLGMGRQLLADEPAFAAAVAELEPDFVAATGFSLQQVLAGSPSEPTPPAAGQAAPAASPRAAARQAAAASRMAARASVRAARENPLVGIDRIQPVLVGVQLALTRLWRHYGVVPDAVVGHSMGEVTAAVVAGALSPAQGLRVIATRSRLMARLSGQGAMALLELDAAAVGAFIADYPEVTIAVYASPRQTVIAGPPGVVDELCARVQRDNRLARRVDVDVASHHPTIDPILGDLRAALADLVPGRAVIPIVSTVYESPGSAAVVFDAEHWVSNLRNPVRFHQAITAAGRDYNTFVEVSPHPLLLHAISDTLGSAEHYTVPTLWRDTNDTLTFHANLNTAHLPQAQHPAEPHPRLPRTPWQHTRHWIDAAPVQAIQLLKAPAAEDVPVQNGSAAVNGFRATLRDSDPGERHDLLADHVGMLVAAVMGMPPAQRLEPTAGFFQLGMDSMMSVLLQRALVETLSEPLPITIVFDYPSVEALTNYLATTLPELAEATDLAGAGQVSLPGKG